MHQGNKYFFAKVQFKNENSNSGVTNNTGFTSS